MSSTENQLGAEVAAADHDPEIDPAAAGDTPDTPDFATPSFDTDRRFVRVTHVRDNGFVEFDFAIGEPDLFVEMVLPRAAFEEFREEHHAIELPPDGSPSEDPADATHWRLADVRPAG